MTSAQAPSERVADVLPGSGGATGARTPGCPAGRERRSGRRGGAALLLLVGLEDLARDRTGDAARDRAGGQAHATDEQFLRTDAVRAVARRGSRLRDRRAAQLGRRGGR